MLGLISGIGASVVGEEIKDFAKDEINKKIKPFESVNNYLNNLNSQLQQQQDANFINDLNNQGQTNQTQHAAQQSTLLLQVNPTGVTVAKPQMPSIENTSFYKKYEKDKKRNLFKGVVNDLFGSAEQMGGKIGALAEAGKFLMGDVAPFIYDAITGNIDMSDPEGKNAKKKQEIMLENQEETTKATKERTNLVSGMMNYDPPSQNGPLNSIPLQNNFALNSDPNKATQPVLAEKGVKLNNQDKFDLSLGRFYRNTLEGPSYTGLESYNENIKDAKNLANTLINKTPKQSNIPIMRLFIDYKNQPNFKVKYLLLFR